MHSNVRNNSKHEPRGVHARLVLQSRLSHYEHISVVCVLVFADLECISPHKNNTSFNQEIALLR